VRLGTMPFVIGPKTHNIISPSLKVLIEEFFGIMDWKGVFLSGGTCLAEYYFGHRISFDMDLFAIDQGIFNQARLALSDPKSFSTGAISTVRTTPHLDQFLFQPKTGSDPIKIDLMLETSPRLSTPLKVETVWIDSLEDLLSNKLGCIVQRSDIKDYIDLYYLIPASHLTMKELIEVGQKKEGGLDPLIMAQQIEYLLKNPSLETGIRPILIKPIDWADLLLFFKKIQKECLELIRPS
jgi:hypothetical protein